ncbi:hypothetical protein AVEN_257253-1 [Araneus ventricosus]|uniref:RNA-directed DNA polymerase n=1 Tax=Araneus ventricosus TaxID=182803 RepID=A0A4Y2NKR0_ARAVE|nr:hypothetical protein AVEN_257253-1 [Araneus ventricosus]
MRKKVDFAIDKLLDQGVLEPNSNPKWSTPLLPIIKQSGEIRLCADYKVTINKVMKNHPYPITSVNHILANLADGKFFAKIVLAHSYFQLRFDDASAEALTIITHTVAFKVNRIEKRKSLARCYVYWPKIEEDIEDHVGLCERCQQTRHASPHSPAHPCEETTKPRSRTWIPGTVIDKTCSLSHKTVTPDGKSIRCHIDQMRNRKTPLVSAQTSPETETASSAIPSSSNATIKPSDPPAEIETPKEAPTESLLYRPRRNHN